MFKFLTNLFSEEKPKEDNVNITYKEKKLSLFDATSFVQKQMLENDEIASGLEKQEVLKLAMSGDLEGRKQVKEYIKNIIIYYRIEVDKFTADMLMEEIYSYAWGLGPVEKYNIDDSIDEIRVNSKDRVYIVKNGISEKTEAKFKDEAEVENIIKRMILDDMGISLDQSSPKIVSVRKDGTRLTATCYPITNTWTFTLRKHSSFVPTVENYIEKETFDKSVWNILKLLVKGRASILFSGNVGAGKTTLMKRMIGELHKKLRIIVISKDLELKLLEEYPDRDILEFEEHPEIGITMKELIELSLRESPDAIIIEEFIGAGEAIEAIKACTRGLPGSMATAHFNSSEEAVEGCALFMLEEGINLDLDMAKLRVARAYNIVVQLFGDAISGKKKVTGITEIGVNDEGNIFYNKILEWEPETEDYLGRGKWKRKNKPSYKLVKHLLKNIKEEDLRNIGWLGLSKKKISYL